MIDVPLPLEAEDLEGVRDWIDEPDVLHAGARVDGYLLRAIELARRIGEHLADPVGREIEVGQLVGHHGHSLASPTGHVGHENVLDEMKLRLVEQDRSARAPSPSLECGAELLPERASRRRASDCGCRS